MLPGFGSRSSCLSKSVSVEEVAGAFSYFSQFDMALVRCFWIFWALTALTAVDASEDGTCQDSSCSAQFLQVQAQTRSANHPWPHARGSPWRASGQTPEAWTSHSLAWTFHDPKGQYHNVFAGGTVIDQDKNLFQMTNKGLFALNSTGQQIWHYNPPGRSNNEITLVGELILGTTTLGNAFAVNRQSGQEVWVTNMAPDAGGDCGYPAAHDGIFVAGASVSLETNGGNKKVVALDAKQGTKLWEYNPDKSLVGLNLYIIFICIHLLCICYSSFLCLLMPFVLKLCSFFHRSPIFDWILWQEQRNPTKIL